MAWFEAYGEPPKDKPYVLHHCDNPPCYEITHLYVGDQGDNMKDARDRGRLHFQSQTHCKHGHPLSGENLRVDKHGRKCRACDKAAKAKYRAKKEARG